MDLSCLISLCKKYNDIFILLVFMKKLLQVKHDIKKNWDKAVNFIPEANELILYDGVIENGKYVELPMLKIGDGHTKLNDLELLKIESLNSNSSKCEYIDGVLKINSWEVFK